MLEKIIAYRAYGIIADWDGNAPEAHVIYVATNELGEEIVGILNQHPRRVGYVAVEGYEYCKRFRCEPAVIEREDQAHVTLKDAMGEIFDREDWQPGDWDDECD
jgi:hypothetical protein